jgi:crotonobetainyl-CoA:carnitine CoA-transferase CaiB-like acyl-CoA transferase
MATPLADLRILDLLRVLAAPVAAQYFGDMGADVIKVEPPRLGEHSAEELREIGYDDARIAALATSGVIRCGIT